MRISFVTVVREKKSMEKHRPVALLLRYRILTRHMDVSKKLPTKYGALILVALRLSVVM